jgi:hypothetical protein
MFHVTSNFLKELSTGYKAVYAGVFEMPLSGEHSEDNCLTPSQPYHFLNWHEKVRSNFSSVKWVVLRTWV